MTEVAYSSLGNACWSWGLGKAMSGEGNKVEGEDLCDPLEVEAGIEVRPRRGSADLAMRPLDLEERQRR